MISDQKLIHTIGALLSELRILRQVVWEIGQDLEQLRKIAEDDHQSTDQ